MKAQVEGIPKVNRGVSNTTDKDSMRTQENGSEKGSNNEKSESIDNTINSKNTDGPQKTARNNKVGLIFLPMLESLRLLGQFTNWLPMIYDRLFYNFFKDDKLAIDKSKDTNNGNIENDTQHELKSTTKVWIFNSVMV